MSVCKRAAKSPVREKRTHGSMGVVSGNRYSYPYKKLLISILATGLLGCGTVEDKKMLTSIKGGKIKVAACKQSINLIDCENPKEWTGKVLLNKKVKRSGKFSFETFGKYPTRTDFKNFIPINPDRTYTLSCYMRSLDPKQAASGHMGLYMYDKNKKLIAYSQVVVYLGTESKLAAPAIKGTKEIFIKKNVKCLKLKNWVLAFNAKAQYADLPNYDLSPRGKNITVDGDKLKLTLRSPLKKSYKKGTQIRLHCPWGAPFYWAAQGWMPGEWKKFSVTLKGIAAYGASNKKFWKGTKYVKPFFWFGNCNRIPESGAKLLVDDFSFVEFK